MPEDNALRLASGTRVSDSAAMVQTPVLPPVRALFRAVVETAAPRAGGFGEAQWERAEALVEAALGQRPPAVRRQLILFLRAVGALAFVRHGRTFPRLSPKRRLRILEGLESSRLLPLRRGVWGVRTLAFLAVYGQEEVRTAIGYRASAEGWAARRPEPGPQGPATGGGEAGGPSTRSP
jgi:hypothetical protein